MNSTRSRPCYVLAMAITGVLLACTSASLGQLKKPTIPIVDAQHLALGSEVTIAGTVTVASGTFKSSFDDYGFQIEDITGGMYVAVKTDLHLIVGEKVRVTGKRSETALKFQIIETDETQVQILRGKNLIRPIMTRTGSINDGTVGRLIRITADITEPVDEVAPYGFRVPVDDGSGEVIAYVSTSTGISSGQFIAGLKVQLTGIAGKFNSHFQIYPRSQDDVSAGKKTFKQ